MKIAFMIPTFYPVVGGAQTNCYSLAKELIKLGHKVSVFCYGDNDTMRVVDGIDVYNCKLKKSFSYYLKFYGTLDKILLQDFDVVHIHGFGFYQQDKIVKRISKEKPKTKIVCTPHGPFMALKYGLLGKTYKTLYTPFVKKMAGRCDRIIQVNPSQYIWMREEYDIHQKIIRLVPNGVDDNLFEFIQSKTVDIYRDKHNLKDKYVLTYIGRVQPYKGIETVIRVLHKLPDNVVFVVIGKDAGNMDELKQLAKKLGVEDKVIFTGYVEEEEKLCLLEISKIYVFPSEWEAFGIGTLEAMAKGNAIVSSRTEGGEYLVKRSNGNLFNYKDEKQLEFSIMNIINDEGQRMEMSINNIKKAKMFRWSKIVRELEEVYDNIENDA